MDITRRGLIMLGGGLVMADAPSLKAATSLNLDKRGERARVRAKVMGSTDAEDVHTFTRIHFYGYLNEGNLIPFYTMNHLNIRRWTPHPDGSFSVEIFECGTLSKFDTEESLNVWENPITRERIKAHHPRSGPLEVTLTKEGSISTGSKANGKLESLNFQFIDDSIYVLHASAYSYPNPFQPDEWPKESSGAEVFSDSHYIFISKIADVTDSRSGQAPTYVQVQNMASWSPWLRMGQTPGRTWGRGFGSKIASIDHIPSFARADLERHHPQILDIESWTDPVDEWADYKKEHSPECG